MQLERCCDHLGLSRGRCYIVKSPIQERYALRYHQFGAGEFELGSVYNFRQCLSRYNQEHGVNVLEQVFEDISDQQIQTLEVRTGQQGMDST